MNQRIKELAEQADVNLSPFQFSGIPIKYEVTETVLQKFAELIVRECVEVVKWTPSQFPNDEYVKCIREHFGVE